MSASTGGAPSPDPVENADPVVVPAGAIDAEGEVMALVTTEKSVCWTSFSAKAPASSLVACASKSDGSRVELLRDALVHPGLGVSGDHLYWSTEITASIDRAPLAGGAVSPFVTRKGPHGRFVVDQHGSLYWLLDGGTRGTGLFTASQSGDPHELANLGAADSDLLAIYEYTVYDYPRIYSWSNGPRLGTASETHTPLQLSGGCFYPVDLATDGEHVFWSCQDGTFHWIARAGGGEEHVATGMGWGAIAPFRAEAAYVTDSDGGRVHRLTLASGRWDVIARGLHRPSRIAVDASGVYVSEGRTIRRLAR